MSKTVNLREFQHRLSSISARLKPGESVSITKHGQPLGVFTKAAQPKKAPDYLANLGRLGQSAAAGQKFIDDLCALS